MARGNKEVKVEVRETERNTEDFVELELIITDEKIGTVQQEGKKNPTVSMKDGKSFVVKTVDAGINDLIMDYNLHN